MPDEHTSGSCSLSVRFVSTKLEDGNYQLSAIVNDTQPPIDICKMNTLTPEEVREIAENYEQNLATAARTALTNLAQELSNPMIARIARRFCDR